MRIVYVLLFWIVAAALVVIAHGVVPHGALLVQTVGIVGAALAYIRLTAPRATVQHALAVGIVWVLLSIGAELVRGYTLIGTPLHPVERDLLLLTWIVAPALFVRSDATAHQPVTSAR